MSTTTGRQVPWEIASYSPWVHAQTLLALNSGHSLNGTTADADWNLATRQGRDDLHDAFQRMADRFITYLPGGSKHQPQISDTVLDARDALRRGDLDAALEHLTAAMEQRELMHGADPVDVTVDQVLEIAAARLHSATQEVTDQAAALGSSRGPGMSAVTAANRVSDVVDEADRTGRRVELTDNDIDALARVDPEQAADTARRADWQHRRPERAPQQPNLGLPEQQR